MTVAGSGGGAVAGYYLAGYYREGAIPGYYPPTADWYCQGPTIGSAGRTVSPQALQGPAGPSAHLRLPHP